MMKMQPRDKDEIIQEISQKKKKIILKTKGES